MVLSAVESVVCVGRVDVHLFVWVSIVFDDFLGCHIGKAGTEPCGFDAT
jgi:hypothetical protein